MFMIGSFIPSFLSILRRYLPKFTFTTMPNRNTREIDKKSKPSPCFIMWTVVFKLLFPVISVKSYVQNAYLLWFYKVLTGSILRRERKKINAGLNICLDWNSHLVFYRNIYYFENFYHENIRLIPYLFLINRQIKIVERFYNT